MTYLSPKKDETIFTEYWNKYIEGICNRKNFKVEHLDQLKILCDLFVEHDDVIEEIKTEGRTYYSEGRNGRQLKIHPLVGQLNHVRSEIRAYTKCLGITLAEDSNEETEGKEEWK